MCGIVGFYGFESRAIEDSLRQIVHRGPDGDGVFSDPPLWMGMRRLSIIDLAGSDQPIYNEDRSLAIVFNGEIYNYRELRERLLAKGHSFRTDGDTETIVHLYEEYGRACVHLLRGMFAFAIWDRRQRALFVARDRLGIKPLYYHWDGRRLAFGSEIKALRVLPEIGRRIDHDALDHLLASRYVPGPRTMYEDISCLQPGHTLWLQQGKLRVERYWAPVVESAYNDLSHADAALIARRLLEEAVRLHLAADVPLGVLLSGGLDSAALVALMSQSTSNIRTFTVGFHYARSAEGREYDETARAQSVARHFGTDHHEVHIDAGIVDLLPRLMWHFDQPVADPAALPTYLISHFARQSVKVALSGEGSDELFGGYPRYYWEARAQQAQRIVPRSLARAMVRSVRALPLRPERAKRAALLLNRVSPTERLVAWTGGAPRRRRAGLLRAPSAEPLPQAAYLGDGTSIHQLMRSDISTWLVDDVLTKADKMSMAASLELRVPFLDHQVVEFVTSLPEQFKRPVPTTKPLLREAMTPLLPPEALAVPKRAFSVPIAEWLRGELRAYGQERLLEVPAAEEHGLLDRTAIRTVWDEHLAGRRNHAPLLWTVLCFETWYHEVFRRPERTDFLTMPLQATA